jgi:hypothetical protein
MQCYKRSLAIGLGIVEVFKEAGAGVYLIDLWEETLPRAQA